MKLIYLANIRLPSERAHATQIFNMCNGFVTAGVDTTLVVADRKTSITQPIEEYYGQKQLFKLKKIKTLELNRFGSFFFHLSGLIFALKGAQLFKKNNSDLAYSREELLLYILSFLIPPKQLVWESHQAKYNFFARSLVKRGAKLVVISEGIRDHYIERGIAADKILVAHDAVDPSFFMELPSKHQARTELGLPSDAKIAMYIGGFDIWKGIGTFLKASTENPEVLFVAIGGKKEEIEKYSAKYPTVVFLGERPYRELPVHQQAADVLVIPNTAQTALSSKYTSPLKLFAHMTSRRPIVASNVPSITNVLSEQEALLFEADNSHMLSVKISEAINSSDVAGQKAEQAYKLSNAYTWKNRAEFIKSKIEC